MMTTAGGPPLVRFRARRARGADRRPALAADSYGFHNGDIWYRGRFEGGAAMRRITLHYGAGGAGMLQLWCDGRFVGENELPAACRAHHHGCRQFTLPAEAQSAGTHLLAVMVRNNGHNWDLMADEAHKEARGLISASLDAGSGAQLRGSDRVENPGQSGWRGHCRGSGPASPIMAGSMANASAGTCPASTMRAGVPPAFQRPMSRRARAGTARISTSLFLPATMQPSAFRSATPQRRARPALIACLSSSTVTNMGQFIANVGPQRVFPIPEGILNHRGNNVLALAVTSDGAPGNALEAVRLVTMRNVRGGVPVRMVEAPQ